MQQNYIKYNTETPPKYPQSFTGKERDSETGFSYFGARYYDSDLMTGWLSVDPMADKYPSLSPYAYCAWNPIRLVDPNGEDVWEIDVNGYIIEHKKTREYDKFIVHNIEGKIAEKKFAYGTISRTKTTLSSNGSYDMYQIKGDNNGTELFEFLANNTLPEWSHIKTGLHEDNNAPNFIITSHSYNTEKGAYHLWDNQLKNGYNIREMNHSHSNGIPIPSGLPGAKTYGAGDISFAGKISKYYKSMGQKSPSFNIFNCNGGYVNYSHSSIIPHYNQLMNYYHVEFKDGILTYKQL